MAVEYNPDDSPNIESVIRFLYNEKLNTDFVFISQDGLQKHNVHRLIAAIHSPVLADKLFGESAINEMKITYDNIALQNMISYFYSGDLNLEDIYNIKQTKEIADEYNITGLGRICRERLGEVEITVSNVLNVWEAAAELGNEEKENECYISISKNQEAVFNSEQFLNVSFKKALTIFEKIKNMKMMTESAFLRSAIRWLNKNPNVNGKKALMGKTNIAYISMDDYVDIVTSHECFFMGTEITAALSKIKNHQTTPERPMNNSNRKDQSDIKKVEVLNKQVKELTDNKETLSNEILHQTKLVENLKEQVENIKKSLQLSLKEKESQQMEILNMNEELKERDLIVQEKTDKVEELESEVKKLKEQVESCKSQLSEDSMQKLPQKLSIEILKHEDGVNVFNLEKRARITVSDGIISRSLQIGVDDVLKKGPMGTVLEKKGSYTESDVDISYEGIYFMIRSLKVLEEMLAPTQYVELLKAALHFQLKDLADKCIQKVRLTNDYDPEFLDGLRCLSYLKDKSMGLKGLAEFRDKCITLLTSEPLRVILHPNFINCSSDLIILLLQQTELKVKNESQLLLVIIAWLEAKQKERKLLRKTLLRNLAFQNISTSDFRYAIIHYPNFFLENEQKNILAYRNAVGGEVKFFREKLPEWYNFKTRVLL